MESINWESIFQEGNLLANSGEHQKALEKYLLAKTIKPEDAMTWNNIGVAQLCLGKFDESICNFSKAIFLNPYYKDAFHNRGLAYSDLGDLELARDDLNMAIQLDSQYWSAYRHRSVINQMLGNHDESYDDFLTAKKLEGDPNRK